MRYYPKSIEDCVKELDECASDIYYAGIEGLLTWSSAHLKDLEHEKNYWKECYEIALKNIRKLENQYFIERGHSFNYDK